MTANTAPAPEPALSIPSARTDQAAPGTVYSPAQPPHPWGDVQGNPFLTSLQAICVPLITPMASLRAVSGTEPPDHPAFSVGNRVRAYVLASVTQSEEAVLNLAYQESHMERIAGRSAHLCQGN